MTQEFVTLPREVVKNAISALGNTETESASQYKLEFDSMKALQLALEQPQVEQEPVGFVRQVDIHHLAKTPSDWGSMFGEPVGYNFVPVYTHPQPNREPLDGEEIHRLWDEVDGWFNFARAHGIGSKS